MTVSRAPAGTPVQLGIVLLTLATALIHFSLALPNPFAATLLFMFILNGLGYLVLLGALYLPVPALDGYRNAIRVIFIAYTALTVVLWIFFGAYNAIGYIDKLIEIALIALLFVELRGARA